MFDIDPYKLVEVKEEVGSGAGVEEWTRGILGCRDGGFQIENGYGLASR